ncbi:hypothetical protein HK103_004271 [Boothiomyces macroporosus]|uniref:Ankyrin repeat protein n=1 Tax=Boothiomyces macroporosus TaxID=261099 RepID=A0AAD5UHF4_9FUNG|nr:hypothetical protein HK103_004271 [Boothiomyces macroporosus]
MDFATTGFGVIRRELGIIGSHLTISEYLEFWKCSTSVDIPIKPYLTWNSYVASSHEIFAPDPSLFMNLDAEINDDIIIYLGTMGHVCQFQKCFSRNRFSPEVITQILNACVGKTFPNTFNNFNFNRSRFYPEIIFEIVKDTNFDFGLDFSRLIFCGAAAVGDVQLVEFLLNDRRFNPNVLPGNPLIQAVKNGHFEVVKKLLSDNRVKPTEAEGLPIDVVSLAATYNHTDIAKLLLNNSNVDVTIRDQYYFRYFVVQGNLEMVEYMLKTPLVDPAVLNNVAICDASFYGHFEIVTRLLQHPDVNPADVDNRAFRRAAENGHLNVVRLLVADQRVDPADNSNKALQVACNNLHLEIVKILLADQRVLNSVDDNNVMEKCCQRGDTVLVELLLGYAQFNPAARDNRCIRMACEGGHYHVMKLLLADPRVDPTIRNHELLRTATLLGHHHVVKLLLEDGRCNPAQIRNTSIQVAAASGHFSVLELLIKDSRVKFDEKYSLALELAAEQRNIGVVERLLPKQYNIYDGTAFFWAHQNELPSLFRFLQEIIIGSTHEHCSAGIHQDISYVIKLGYTAMAKFLLEQTVHSKENLGQFVRIAAYYGRVDILRLLELDGVENGVLNQAFTTVCIKGHFSCAHYFLNNRKLAVDPSHSDNLPFRLACRAGHYSIVKLLAKDPRVDVNSRKSQGFRMACGRGHYSIVKFLLQNTQIIPNTKSNQAIRLACAEGHYKIVKLLLQDPRVDPSACESQALQFAAYKGYTHIVERLLEDSRIEKYTNNYFAINAAACYGYSEIVELLLPEGRMLFHPRTIQWANEIGANDLLQFIIEYQS